MKIKWLAHSCFLLTADDGTTILTDPYEPGGFDGAIRHAPYAEPVDIVTISHDHADHSYTAGLAGSPNIINGLELASQGGLVRSGPVILRAVRTFHDKKKGAERGENAIVAVELDNVDVVHLGDIGHTLSDEVATLGPIDVLLTPVGGHFTVDAKEASEIVKTINPKIVIPMHVKTPKLDFPIAPVDEFLAGKPNVERIAGSEIELRRGTLPTETTIMVLEPAL